MEESDQPIQEVPYTTSRQKLQLDCLLCFILYWLVLDNTIITADSDGCWATTRSIVGQYGHLFGQ